VMPNLADFGEREPEKQAPRGRRTRPLSPSRVMRAKTRDTLIEEELKAIAAGLDRQGRDQFIQIDTLRTVAKPEGKSRNMHHPKDSDIFGAPVQEKKPTPRIRPDFKLEELAALQHNDPRREQTAEVMASDADMLSKMYQCQYPMPRADSPKAKRKRSFKLPEHEENAAEPAGFKGLGSRCPPEKPRGLAGAPQAPFVPDFKPVPRHGGKKMANQPTNEGIFPTPMPPTPRDGQQSSAQPTPREGYLRQ
jgi:hypothetical protein